MDGVNSGWYRGHQQLFHTPPSAGLLCPSPSPRLRWMAGAPPLPSRASPAPLSQVPWAPTPTLNPSSCMEHCCLRVDVD